MLSSAVYLKKRPTSGFGGGCNDKANIFREQKSTLTVQKNNNKKKSMKKKKKDEKEEERRRRRRRRRR